MSTQTQRKRKRKRRKKQSRLPLILGTALFIIVIAGALAGYFLYRRYSYGTERADVSAYFGQSAPGEYPLLLNGELTDAKAKRIDNAYYLPLEFVHTHISDRFYYGEADGILVYSTPHALITSAVGSSDLDSTTEGHSIFPCAVSLMENGDLYLSIDYIRQYFNVSYEAFTEPNRMVMTIDTYTAESALIVKDTWIRRAGGVKSEIIEDLHEGDRVVIVDDTYDDWIKVRTASGFSGYVESKRMGEREAYTYGSDAVTQPLYTGISRSYPICLGWHQIAGVGGNDTLQEVIASARAMNVISPTWIRLSDDFGSIESFGQTAYVETAHRAGLEVWVLVSNFENADVDTGAVVSRASSRKTLTDNLIAEIKRLGAEGINVDFEGVPESYGKDYVQWLRELSIACRREQIVLSVDNYVPYEFNDYYNRREQGIIADYVIIMGYDEHYGGSPVAGSVASIDFVRHGIEATLLQVPAEKVINAVPFYTRVWTTKADGSVTSFATGMGAAKEAAAERGITFSWDTESGQYYGARQLDNGDKIEIWLEDYESLTEKCAVMRANGIAGVAGWRLGLESAEAWDALSDYVGGTYSR